MLRVALLCAGLVAIGSPLHAVTSPPRDTIVRGPLAARIDEHLSRAARFGFAGALLVAKDGEVILHKGYGLADRESGRPFSSETIFDIGSITKQFTAAAVLALEEQGRLRVSDTIGRYFDAVPPDKAGITLHHLLTHTAGLEDGFGGDYDPAPRDSLVRVALGSKLLWAPGTRYQYSNVGYSLLGAIVEKVSGQPYERFLHERLFRPAGLTRTGYRLVEWPRERLAVGYRGTERWGTPLDHAWAPDGPFWHLRANGGLLSTVGDLYRWHLALETDRVLSDSSRAKAFRNWVPESDDGTSSYGYGWAVTPTPRGTTLIWHNGGNGYFFADFRRYVGDRVVVIFATNESVNEAVERDVVRLVFGQDVAEIPVVVGTGIDSTQLGRYAGTYRLASGGGIEFEIRNAGGALEIPAADPEVATAFVSLPPLDAAQRQRLEGGGIDSVTAHIVAGMAAGDFGPFREHFLPVAGFKVDDEVGFWTGALKGWSERWGPFRGSAVLATRAGPARGMTALQTYVAVRFARGARVIRFLQPSEGPKRGFFVETVSSSGLPGRHLLLPRSATEFVTYSLAFRAPTEVTFLLDGDRVVGLKVGRGDRIAKIR